MTIILDATGNSLRWLMSSAPETSMDRIVLAAVGIPIPASQETPLTRADLVAWVGRYATVVDATGARIDTAELAARLAKGAVMN